MYLVSLSTNKRMEQEVILYQFNDCFELQMIDTNCNHCIHMERDLDKWKYWHDIKRNWEETEFNRLKEKAIKEAEAIEDESNRRGMLRVAHKMRFQFEKKGLISYGYCKVKDIQVTFMPQICCPENQGCFKHRKVSNEKIEIQK